MIRKSCEAVKTNKVHGEAGGVIDEVLSKRKSEVEAGINGQANTEKS